jgi:hypothetical protein
MATVASRSNLVGLSVTKLITLAVLRKKANMLRAERDRAVRRTANARTHGVVVPSR